MVATVIGSAWYHLAPDNGRLVWDRLPIALGSVALLAWVLAERVSLSLGRRLLIPLLLGAAAAVAWWSRTESAGDGDLRPYALVQFYPAVAIPLVLLLFPVARSGPSRTAVRVSAEPISVPTWLAVLAAYVLARLGEVLDRPIFEATGALVSGHTLKHLAAGLAVWILARGVARARDPAEESKGT